MALISRTRGGLRGRARLAAVATLLAITAASCGSGPSERTAGDPFVVGAVYPLSGAQGQGGVDEYRGVELAVDLVNDDGGVQGRPVDLRAVDVPTSEAAPDAVASLAYQGIDVVLGSYGSTISAPASEEAARRGMLFWETGAVGMLAPASDRGTTTFRMPPTGEVLGSAAIDFIADEAMPADGHDPQDLRYAISFVDDVYGRSVARGARQALRRRGLRDVGSFGYDARTVDVRDLTQRIAAARPDVLFVSAYLEDAIALRRELVRQQVPLLANIGTSSSYCMPEFGATLGKKAVGVYASDKPSASTIDPAGLRPEAAALLARADEAFRERWGTSMDPPALAGFSAAWALLADVAPGAASLTPPDIASAALRVERPRGSLPNGSGLRFGQPGTPSAGDNLAAASVIWEWVAPGKAAVIWPEAFATEPIDPSADPAW
jgi:branched-chain amino acid transport system substrate-binding protein